MQSLPQSDDCAYGRERRLARESGGTAVDHAIRHALGWLVFGNLAGLYLSLLLLFPDLQLAHWTYGRWVPVHLNVQLYGWTSLPLVAWLFSIYQVDSSKARAWASAVVWAWTAALALGVLHWLGGVSSGKIFLDWKGGALWGFIAAQVMLWLVLAAAWRERSGSWNAPRKLASLAGLSGLLMVPVSLAFAASPSVYPPVDRTTGGPTGASLLGSTLFVVGLMLLLPRLAAVSLEGKKSRGIWIFFALSWLVFGVTEVLGGTHLDALQIGALLMLLPWAWWIPRDWAGFDWPEGSKVWRGAMLGWWAMLVVSGLLMYQPGILDHLKFTQGLVAHTHLAMAGFTTSFCALLLVLITGRRIGGAWSVALWHAAALGMIVVLALMGWKEGDGPSWMLALPVWRGWGLVLRSVFGLLMLWVSVVWWMERRAT
jgi:cytochrome c oxidase cbb3-type subunit 1